MTEDNVEVGKQVVPGPDFDFEYGKQDDKQVGIIEVDYFDGWVVVRWIDTDNRDDRSVGADGIYELYYNGK